MSSAVITLVSDAMGRRIRAFSTVQDLDGAPSGVDNDAAHHRALLAALPADVAAEVEVVDGYVTPARFRSLARGLEAVVSERMHAAMLAMLALTSASAPSSAAGPHRLARAIRASHASSLVARTQLVRDRVVAAGEDPSEHARVPARELRRVDHHRHADLREERMDG